MRRRIQISIVLLLGFLATGTQWDLLQAFAWGRMMANYSRTESLAGAAASTFNGQMCSICRMVANARKQERSRSDLPAPKLETKVLLFFQSVPPVAVEAPRVLAWIPTDARALTQERAMPPVPPPRAELA